MLFQNLSDDIDREKFRKILEENLNTKIDYWKCFDGDDVNGYVFSSSESSTILSVERNKEELFTPSSNEQSSKINESINGFNKMCDRNNKLNQIFS